MPSCNTGRNIQKYKGAAASTLQDVTDNGNTTTGDIITTSGFFIGDGSKITGISGIGTAFTLQETSDSGNTTSNTIQFTNTITSFTTSGNVLISGNVTASNFYGDGSELTSVALKSDLTSNASRVGVLETDLTSNASRVGVLETDLTSNASRVGVLETDLTSNASRVGVLETDLTSNVGRISTLETKTTDISYIDGTTSISGNLTVLGNTTTIDTVNLIVQDPILQLSNASASVDSGILIARPSGTDNVFVGFDQSLSEFAIGFTDSHAGLSEIAIKDEQDFTLNVHGNVEASYYFGDGTQLIGVALKSDLSSNVIRIGNLESEVQPVNRGGTNITSYGTGDMLFASASSTLSKLTPSTAGYFLQTNGTGNAPTWENVADIGSATPANLYTDDFITGGPWSGITDANLRVLGSVSNLSNQLVARDDKGDIFVSNVHAIRINGDGTFLTGVALSTDLTSNASRVGVLETDLTSNASRVGVLETDLTSNASRVGVLETDLTSNASRVGVLETDLTSNASRVGVLETDLTSNASRVGVLETDLTSNASRVGVLETDLTSNASRVGVLETDLTSNASRVGVLETDLTSNASRVGVLETDLASNSTSITNLQNSTIISNSSGITNAFETGDLIYASSQNTLSNLSIGSTNEVLTVSGTGIPVWATASGGGGGGYWTQHINGNDIYYNSGNVGIANTAPTNTLSVGTVVSIQETASGDVLIVKGGGYFNDDVYIAKRLTVPVGGEIKADTIKVRSLSQKGTLVVAERLVDTISLG